MSRTSDRAVLGELFESVSECFTPDVARRIAGLRAPSHVQARIDELAEKCSDGTLSADEKHFYEMYVWAIDAIGTMQARARDMLASK